MDFKEFLLNKHLLIKGERKLKEISANQYNNRFKSMCEKKIDSGEKQMESLLIGRIQNQYRDWKTYVKTIEYYLAYHNLK